ncbi:MAG: hypothetical protein J5814_02935 [Bacteroidaceae bacterium]|nr:hypothetical protein [Bacteroidaceae bacterium]
MSIQYDLVQMPAREGEEPSQNYYPRFVSRGTVDLEGLIDKIETKCDRPTVYRVVTALEEVIAQELCRSHRVRLGDIGTFSPHLEGGPVADRSDIRAGSISVDSINFVPTKSFLRRCNAEGIERARTGFRASANLRIDEQKALLNEWFVTHREINTPQFAALSGIRIDKARKALKDLVADGFLLCLGHRNSTHYIPA